MSNLTMSIRGLYLAQPSIFDGLRLPDAIEKQTLIPELVAQCAEFEILYPDPLFMKNMIRTWSTAMLYKWDKLYNTMLLQYDPISNYDRHEEWTDSGSSEVSPGSTQTTSQQGYNEAGFVDATKVTAGGKDSTEASSTHSGRMYGNIGVTTSQQMLQSERDVADFNIYQIIIDDFKRRFCVMVY